MGTIFCPRPDPSFLIISDLVPQLLYYSHVPAAIISILFAFLIFSQDRKSLTNRLLIFILITFSSWSFFDLIVWAANDTRVVMLFWSLLILIEPMIFACSVYLVHVFINKKDISLRKKTLMGILLLPVIVFLPTQHVLSYIFLSSDCEGPEGFIAIQYVYSIEAFFTGWLIVFSFLKYRQCASKEFKKQILYLVLGISMFLLAFAWGNLISSLTFNWEISQYGLFGMPIFIAFLTYLIVKYNAFKIRMFAAQALVIALVILIGSQFLFVRNATNRILTGITLILATTFGWWLIRSVKDEIRQKEELLDMTDKLSQAYSKMKQLDRAKSEFVSIASHQLRTPLTAIKGFISLLLDGSYGRVTKNVRTVLEKVYLSNERLINLVEDLLNISRIESGKFVFNFRPNDVGVLVGEIVDSMRFAAKNKNLYLDYAPPTKPIEPFVFDKDKLREVINNLIDNAIKYTKKGGVTVRIRQVKDGSQTFDFDNTKIPGGKGGKSVVLKGKRKEDDGNLVQIMVSDTGIGIEPGEEKYIFEKFQRGKDINKVHTEGVGLGLYVAHKIIEAHEAKIWAESDGLARGSRFYIQLRKDFVPPMPANGNAEDGKSTVTLIDYDDKETVK